jgi:hypothetical protein
MSDKTSLAAEVDRESALAIEPVDEDEAEPPGGLWGTEENFVSLSPPATQQIKTTM